MCAPSSLLLDAYLYSVREANIRTIFGYGWQDENTQRWKRHFLRASVSHSALLVRESFLVNVEEWKGPERNRVPQ